MRTMAVAAAVLLALPTAAQAQMYKCVDERGVTQYSDKPRPDCKGQKVDIQPIPPVGGKVQERSQDASRDEAEFRGRQIERERVESRELAAKKALAQRCARLQQDYGRTASARRIVEKYDSNGESVYMDDAARERRLAQLREEMRGCP